MDQIKDVGHGRTYSTKKILEYTMNSVSGAKNWFSLSKYISLVCQSVCSFILHHKILGSISCFGSSPISNEFVDKQLLYPSMQTPHLGPNIMPVQCTLYRQYSVHHGTSTYSLQKPLQIDSYINIFINYLQCLQMEG